MTPRPDLNRLFGFGVLLAEAFVEDGRGLVAQLLVERGAIKTLRS
jgi:hypothetical protein